MSIQTQRRINSQTDAQTARAVNALQISDLPDNIQDVIAEAIARWRGNSVGMIEMGHFFDIVNNYVRHRLTNYDEVINAVDVYSGHEVRYVLKELIENAVFEKYGDIYDDLVAARTVVVVKFPNNYGENAIAA